MSCVNEFKKLPSLVTHLGLNRLKHFATSVILKKHNSTSVLLTHRFIWYVTIYWTLQDLSVSLVWKIDLTKVF